MKNPYLLLILSSLILFACSQNANQTEKEPAIIFEKDLSLVPEILAKADFSEDEESLGNYLFLQAEEGKLKATKDGKTLSVEDIKAMKLLGTDTILITDPETMEERQEVVKSMLNPAMVKCNYIIKTTINDKNQIASEVISISLIHPSMGSMGEFNGNEELFEVSLDQ